MEDETAAVRTVSESAVNIPADVAATTVADVPSDVVSATVVDVTDIVTAGAMTVTGRRTVVHDEAAIDASIVDDITAAEGDSIRGATEPDKLEDVCSKVATLVTGATDAETGVLLVEKLSKDTFGNAIKGEAVIATDTGDTTGAPTSAFGTLMGIAACTACLRAASISSGIVHLDCFVTLL